MSPTEFDLRAALRAGEGDSVDADAIIADGRARIAHRRVRVLSGAAAAVVVAGVALGGSLLSGGGNGNREAGSAGGSAAYAHSAGTGGGAAAGNAPRKAAAATPAASGAASSPSCPAVLPTYPTTANGVTGKQATSPLFAKSVKGIVVCSYSQELGATGTPVRVVLNGDRAAELATSLNSAPTAIAGRECPATIDGSSEQLAIVGVADDGSAAGTVTVRLSSGCSSVVTNGTSIRYEWEPPADVRSLVLGLTPTATSASSTPSQLKGSPIKS